MKNISKSEIIRRLKSLGVSQQSTHLEIKINYSAEIMANARRPQVGDPEINPPTVKAIKRAPVPVLERVALALGVLGLLLSSGTVGWMLCEISNK